MVENMAENSAPKHSGQWAKGVSGNPKGKPKGARHRATQLVMTLLDGEAKALTRRAIALALGGDVVALRLCLERLAPAMKDAPVTIDLPPLTSAEDAARAMAAVVGQMATGEITPGEAAAVAGVIEAYRRTLETGEIEARLAALEAKRP